MKAEAQKLVDAVNGYDTYRGSLKTVLKAAEEFRTAAKLEVSVCHDEVVDLARDAVRDCPQMTAEQGAAESQALRAAYHVHEALEALRDVSSRRAVRKLLAAQESLNQALRALCR